MWCFAVSVPPISSIADPVPVVPLSRQSSEAGCFVLYHLVRTDRCVEVLLDNWAKGVAMWPDGRVGGAKLVVASIAYMHMKGTKEALPCEPQYQHLCPTMFRP